MKSNEQAMPAQADGGCCETIARASGCVSKAEPLNMGSEIAHEVEASKHDLRQAVRQHYGQLATDSTCCDPSQRCCTPTTDPAALSQKLGYTAEEVKAVPE